MRIETFPVSHPYISGNWEGGSSKGNLQIDGTRLASWLSVFKEIEVVSPVALFLFFLFAGPEKH
jgi:hypothetical protein